MRNADWCLPIIKRISIINEVPPVSNPQSSFSNPNSSDSVHCIKQVFTLCIDTHTELFTFDAKSFLQFSRQGPRARRSGDDHHRKFSLHDGLVDINDTATGLGEHLGHALDNAGMIDAKN